jgi:hypothetical protein
MFVDNASPADELLLIMEDAVIVVVVDVAAATDGELLGVSSLLVKKENRFFVCVHSISHAGLPMVWVFRYRQ